VTADILLQGARTGRPRPIGFLDDSGAHTGKTLLGLPVLGGIEMLGVVEHDRVIVAIGDNRKRSLIYSSLAESGESFSCAIHPSVVRATEVGVREGSMICAGVVINTGVEVAHDVILNTSCSVDHHCVVGPHAHVAPGAHLGGYVDVGEGSLIGIGASIAPGVRIGEWSIVGAGAVVVKDVPPGCTVVGVPAHPLEKDQ
jgi:sugar O-acyltransferase (sialic acid O-acetyltransferase NeuD family)